MTRASLRRMRAAMRAGSTVRSSSFYRKAAGSIRGRLRLHQTGAIAAPVDTTLLFKVRKRLSRLPIVRTGSSVPRFLYCRYAFKSNRTRRDTRSACFRRVVRGVDLFEGAALGFEPEHPE